MRGPDPQVVILGAGICGLSCAVALGEAGLRVAVVADAPPEATVSAVAGGLWFPYGVEEGPAGLARARASYDRFEALAAAEPAAAVTMVDYLHLSGRDPWWSAAMPEGRVREAPGGFLARVPLARSPEHLAYLTARARALGGSFLRRR
ncbi:MAG: FAD-dependent oxidoreductase, partial [Actinomycetota bacterium]|nr:FAD-dependent oxidoreductase [Actinomycetota bacterium]